MSNTTTGVGDSAPRESAAQTVKDCAIPLPPLLESGEAFARHFREFADCKVLLIGDASHGTSEFYRARAEITKYMIKHHGFNIVAVEADWPDAEAIDRYARRRPDRGSPEVVPGRGPSQVEQEAAFLRFPTWMWRNSEVQGFVEWLRLHNMEEDINPRDAVGFYGLDLYSMGASINAIINYLDKVDRKMAKLARERYGKLMEWAKDPHEYGLGVLMTDFEGHEKEVMEMLRDLLAKRLEYSAHLLDGEEFHSGEQNARVVADAEKYYKAMYYAANESWNIRDTHMFQTLIRILKHRGGESKAIIWAHNSHVGDARATSMGTTRGELNIGQLCKETFGESMALTIGCSSYTGTVAAASRWDGDMQVMPVVPGMPGSYEELMHNTGMPSFMLDLRESVCDKRLWKELLKRRLERFIGVVYRPDTERASHYSSAVLPKQFDALVWFDKTTPVGALEKHQPQTPVEFDETWPFGL